MLRHPDFVGARMLIFIGEENEFENAEEFGVLMKRRKLPTEAKARAWLCEKRANVGRFASYYARTGWDLENRSIIIGTLDGSKR
jgi:hypothetical protein